MTMMDPFNRGAVLGVDVGFSPKRKTTCFCLMQWDASSISVDFRLTTSDPVERQRATDQLVGSTELHGVALDGPLTRGLRLVPHYRAAEAILSRGVLQTRGKPGQTSSPTGQQLHQHATALALLVLSRVVIADATHIQAIHEKRVVEAFPNTFLAALVPERDLPKLARDASDRYWDALVLSSSRLQALVSLLLPNRRMARDLSNCTHHDHRAGLVCALTALATAKNDAVAVGDPSDGDIMLPPLRAWGASTQAGPPWMEVAVRRNLEAVLLSPKKHANHHAARILWDSTTCP